MLIEILAAVSMVVGGIFAASNWYAMVASRISDRHGSTVPLLGALFLVLGMLGFQKTRPYAWVGILADFGTLVTIFAIPHLVWGFFSTSRFNLLFRSLSDVDGRRDDIRLFKRGVFTIETHFSPPLSCNNHGALVASLGRVGTWKQDGEGFRLFGYREDRILRIKERDGGFFTHEENCTFSNGFQHDGLGGLNLEHLK